VRRGVWSQCPKGAHQIRDMFLSPPPRSCSDTAQEAGSTTDACTVLPVDGKPHQTKPNQTKPNGYHPSPACEEEQLRYARPPSEPQRASCCAFPEIRCVLCLFFFIFHFVMFFNTTCSLSTGLVCLRGRIRAARHKSGGDSGPLQTMHDRLSFAPDGSASNSLNTTQNETWRPPHQPSTGPYYRYRGLRLKFPASLSHPAHNNNRATHTFTRPQKPR